MHQTVVGGIANRNRQEDNLRHSHIEYPDKYRNDDNQKINKTNELGSALYVHDLLTAKWDN